MTLMHIPWGSWTLYSPLNTIERQGLGDRGMPHSWWYHEIETSLTKRHLLGTGYVLDSPSGQEQCGDCRLQSPNRREEVGSGMENVRLLIGSCCSQRVGVFPGMCGNIHNP